MALGRNAMAGTSKIADGALARSRRSAARVPRRLRALLPPGGGRDAARGVRDPRAPPRHAHAGRARRRRWAHSRRRRPDARAVAGRAAVAGPSLPVPGWTPAARSTKSGRCRAVARTRSTRPRASARCAIPRPARRCSPGRESIPCYREPIRAFHAVTAGVQLALDQLHGLEAQPLELTAAMRIIARRPGRGAGSLAGRQGPVRGGPRRRQQRRPAHPGTERPAGRLRAQTKQSPLAGASFRSMRDGVGWGLMGGLMGGLIKL